MNSSLHKKSPKDQLLELIDVFIQNVKLMYYIITIPNVGGSMGPHAHVGPPMGRMLKKIKDLEHLMNINFSFIWRRI